MADDIMLAHWISFVDFNIEFSLVRDFNFFFFNNHFVPNCLPRFFYGLMGTWIGFALWIRTWMDVLVDCSKLDDFTWFAPMWALQFAAALHHL